MTPDSPPDSAVHVGTDGGRPVTRFFGEQTVVKLEPEWTHGAYALRHNVVPPRFTSVPLHVHRDAEEAFWILDGTMTVRAGYVRLEVGPGDACLVPRGTPHTLANLTDEPLTWLTLLSPGARSGWIDDEEELIVAAGGDPSRIDEEALRAVHDRYGLEILGPPPDW